MIDNKIKESIQIAEELAKEIGTGNPSSSLIANKWKEESPLLYRELQKKKFLSQEISFHDSIDVEGSLRETNQRIIIPTRKFSIRTIGIAASVLLAIGTASLCLWTGEQKEVITQWASSRPGNPEVSIIAQDNKTFTIKEKCSTIIKGNQLIGSTFDGKRSFTIDLKPDNQFNRLSVPPGGEYQLTLEDGTVVRVNAASELLFPTHFKKHMRQVHLKGEAYFKVEADQTSPFYVQLGDLNVQVTGTSFNIKAYEEEEDIRIALIEGAVNIRKGQKILATLTPGKLFTYRKTPREYSISDTNLSAITGWTNGKFIFYDETISHIMRELSRWYEVDIHVNDDIKGLRYSGILSREQPLTETLDALSLTNELDFKIYKNKTIDVLEKKDE